MVGVFASLRASLKAGEPVVLATVVELTGVGGGPDVATPVLGAKLLVRRDREPEGSLGGRALDDAVVRDALAALEGGDSSTVVYGRDGAREPAEVAVFLDVFAPVDRLIVLGAVDFSAALVKVAKVLGFRVIVCDARPTFATPARFPEADEVVVDWPHRFLAGISPPLGPRDALCVLTHDHKFDVPAIVEALASDVGYIGAMGSRSTHAGRIERLRREGVDDAGMARLLAPIGIDVGARTPEETAVAICAELIAVRSGTPAPSLRDRSGPIHHPAGARAAGGPV